MNVVELDDPDDPRLADFRAVRLRDDRRQDHFVAEGRSTVEQLLVSRYPVRAVLVLARKLDQVAAMAGIDDVTVLVAPDTVVRGVIGFDLHRGIIAAAQRLPMPALDDVVREASTVAVLEGLNDHENLGALFRSARAFAVDGVVLDPSTADPLYRRCVRVAMGHVLHVPYTRATSWPDAIDVLGSHGFTVAALTPSRDAMPIADLDASRVAFLLGAEGAGLSHAALARADVRVRIPMVDEVDSLNVATAAAIAFATRYPSRRRSTTDRPSPTARATTRAPRP